MASQTTMFATMFATLFCALGVGPSGLTVLPLNRVPAQGQLAADIGDDVSVVNITLFPLCNAIANTIVAAATAAKLGVFTPAACLPLTPALWAPGSPTVRIGGMPALSSTSTCQCAWGGTISVVNPAAVTWMSRDRHGFQALSHGSVEKVLAIFRPPFLVVAWWSYC